MGLLRVNRGDNGFEVEKPKGEREREKARREGARKEREKGRNSENAMSSSPTVCRGAP